MDDSDRRHLISVMAKRYGIRITNGARLLAIDHHGCRLTWPGAVETKGLEPLNPRLAKRDQPYRPLLTSAVLCLFALVTRHLTPPFSNGHQRFRRLFADVGNVLLPTALGGQDPAGAAASLMSYQRALRQQRPGGAGVGAARQPTPRLH